VREILPFLAPVRSGLRQAGSASAVLRVTPAKRLNCCQRILKMGLGAASRAVLFGRVYLGLDQSGEYYPTGRIACL